MLAVREVKKEIGNDFAAIQSMTTEQAKRMIYRGCKRAGYDKSNPYTGAGI